MLLWCPLVSSLTDVVPVFYRLLLLQFVEEFDEDSAGNETGL